MQVQNTMGETCHIHIIHHVHIDARTYIALTSGTSNHRLLNLRNGIGNGWLRAYTPCCYTGNSSYFQLFTAGPANTRIRNMYLTARGHGGCSFSDFY